MAWDIVTRIKTALNRGRQEQRRAVSGLTVRIMTVNLIPLLVLAGGIMYLGQYQNQLIRAELETLRVRSRLFAGAVAEGAIRPADASSVLGSQSPGAFVEALVPELSRRMVHRLSDTTEDRTLLFDVRGKLIADSSRPGGPGDAVRSEIPDDEAPVRSSVSQAIRNMIAHLTSLLPGQIPMPTYAQTGTTPKVNFPDIHLAMQGEASGSAWRRNDGVIILVAAAPVQKTGGTMGGIMLIREGHTIEKALGQVRQDVFQVFLAALSVTFLLSFYLAAGISRPLRRLAHIARDVRKSKHRDIQIPDLSGRNDEIGDLSLALRDMTEALRVRMDSIERFAADVAHEIKNPLTSLRSAVETAQKITDESQRARLMGIILHDVQRLDRLISDISAASRLDAELSRDESDSVTDLHHLLRTLVEAERAPSCPLVLVPAAAAASSAAYCVYGLESRLGQVFGNLIANAVSFSSSGEEVRIALERTGAHIITMVEDRGPGIPENKIETIFERFYSERPEHEEYGAHSGLGLSIARQIVESLGGTVRAENIRAADGRVTGARFVVTLLAKERNA